MRYIRKRRFPFRYGTARKKRGRTRRLLLFAAALSAAWAVVCEAGLSGLSQGLVEEAVREYVLSAVSGAVEAELDGRDASFVSVSRTDTGGVAAISADAASLNGLRAGVTERLSRDLNGKAAAKVSLGSLTGVGVFNGRGPKVPVRLDMKGAANVSFDTELLTAGVNQSCHRVVMTVTVTAFSQSKRFEARVEETVSTVLAETVVVGDVPSLLVGG